MMHDESKESYESADNQGPHSMATVPGSEQIAPGTVDMRTPEAGVGENAVQEEINPHPYDEGNNKAIFDEAFAVLKKLNFPGVCIIGIRESGQAAYASLGIPPEMLSTMLAALAEDAGNSVKNMAATECEESQR